MTLPWWVGCIAWLTISLGTAQFSVAQTIATWTGTAGNGSYNDPTNWDIGVVPIDSGGTTYQVFIGSSQNVTFDVPGTGHQVFQLTTGGSSQFTVDPGRDLLVTDAASIGGLVSTTNGTLSASSAASMFTGTAARILATSGGQITLGVPSLSSTLTSGELITATGTGAAVTLSQLQTINNDQDAGGSPIRVIAARNSGHVDLSALTNVIGGRGGDSLRFETTSGGTMDLSALQSISGFRNVRFMTDAATYSLPALSTIEGAVIFELDAGADLSLPVLTSFYGSGSSFNAALNPTVGGTITANALIEMNDVDITIGDGGTFNAPNVTTFTRGTLSLGSNQTLNVGPLSTIDGSRFLVSGGRTLAVSATSYNSLDFYGGVDMFRATGTGSVLDMSTVQTLDFDDDFGGRRSIRSPPATAEPLTCRA